MYDATRTPPVPPPPAAPKKPFWSRPKVGAAGLVLGLAIGLSGTGDAEPSDEAATAPDEPAQVVQQGATDEEVQQEVDAAVETATDDLEDELAAQQATSESDLRDLRLRARKAQGVAVDKAVARALADVPEPDVESPVVEEEPVVEPDPAPSTDPQFDTCGDAKDAGFGPYYAGQDAEYDWYDDRDDDGIVCE